MVGIAAGRADGRRPFAYSIVPFVTARCLEQIRNDVCEMELPVTSWASAAATWERQ